jgi:hypothetical protein
VTGRRNSDRVLVLACGAIARELARVRDLNGWNQVTIRCLPAALHNTPEAIPAAVEERLDALAADFGRVFVAYADCGTGGELDRTLARRGIERLPGAHCYEFLAGSAVFHELAAEEPGSFYLTDFLVRHFDRLVVRGLGLDRHPELLSQYFGNYRRVVYLAQSDSGELERQARAQAQRLGLDYHYRPCGDGPLQGALRPVLEG